MSKAAFITGLKTANKANNERKELLQACADEDMDWYEASQAVIAYERGEAGKTGKPQADDYLEINKLRRWYKELSETEA